LPDDREAESRDHRVALRRVPLRSFTPDLSDYPQVARLDITLSNQGSRRR
jgi:hypothetical protein